MHTKGELDNYLKENGKRVDYFKNVTEKKVSVTSDDTVKFEAQVKSALGLPSETIITAHLYHTGMEDPQLSSSEEVLTAAQFCNNPNAEAGSGILDWNSFLEKPADGENIVFRFMVETERKAPLSKHPNINRTSCASV